MALTRRAMLQGLATATAAGVAGRARAQGSERPPDVLFISIDDLNDWVGVLGGHVQAQTPNIDRLAASGISFENAHCAAPVCNPSRVATLTGRAPWSTGIYTNHQEFRRHLPHQQTFPQALQDMGYRTLSVGKVFHGGDPDSWTERFPHPCRRSPNLPPSRPRRGARPDIPGAGNIRWGASRRPDPSLHGDHQTAEWALQRLAEDPDQAVFFAIGFFLPHLPWFLPRRWFDQYPLDRIVLPAVHPDDLADLPMAGRRMARIAEHQAIVGADAWAQAVQAYLAALSFSDFQLGRLLDAIDAHPRWSQAIIVLWSDHGWALGEKMHWKKFALWEECTRVPMIIRAPGRTTPGDACTHAVSLLDLVPTLCTLMGIEGAEWLDGRDLSPLLADPSRAWAGAAITATAQGEAAVRTRRWRYIRYPDGSEELYDHRADPNEWHNRATDPSLAATKVQLARLLPADPAPPAPTGRLGCAERTGVSKPPDQQPQ